MAKIFGEHPEELLPILADLYEKARIGEITIYAFYDELEKIEIRDFSRAFHACNAFGIGLDEAKKAYIENSEGGLKTWEGQFENIDFLRP
ncbi:MAG: hypothetical protein AB7J13_02275 [Pyrinomonadaceae bacterium]